MTTETDLPNYLSSKGIQYFRAAGSEVTVHCIWCPDGDPKGKGRLYLNTSSWLYSCKRCGEAGNRHTLLEHFGDQDETRNVGGIDPRMRQKLLNETIDLAHEMLLANEKKLQYLLDRGITPDLIVAMRLGYVPMNVGISEMLPSRGEVKGFHELVSIGLVTLEGREFFNDCIVIPYFSHGTVVQIRAKFVDGKYLTTGGENARLYNADALYGADRVLVTEGELDALAVMSQIERSGQREFEDLAVVGLPGAHSWPDGLIEQLQDKRKVFVGLDPDDVGQKAAEKMKGEVGNKARIVRLPEGEPKCDWTDYFLPKTVKNWGGGHDWHDFRSLLIEADLAGKVLFNIADISTKWQRNRVEAPGLKLGWPSLDGFIRPGLKPGQVFIPLAKSGTGKGHPLSTPVPTPTGLRRWGDLVAGDLVFGRDGKPTVVTGVFDRGVLPTYRVDFSDHSSVEVDGDHIWTVNYRYGAKRDWVGRSDLTTDELAATNLRAGHMGNEWRYIIPMTSPIQYDDSPLPIPAYSLGSIIANGALGSTSVVLSTPDDDVVSRVEAEWAHGVTLIKRAADACPAYVLRGMIGAVRDLGLNVKSGEKFIPEIYQLATESDRSALLEGLLDGDGSVKRRPGRATRYHTTSQRLAGDVRRLVTSLGGTATIQSVQRTLPAGRDYVEYTLNIMCDVRPWSSRKGFEPETCNRTEPRRAIVGVTHVQDQEIRCISVAAKDRLYLITEQHIVTHNTVFLSNISHNLRNKNVLFVSLEMTAAEVYEHLRRIHYFHYPNVSYDDQMKDYDRLRVVEENRVRPGDLTDYIHEYQADVGERPDVVVVDYLQYFARGFRGATPYERASDAIMETKAVGKEERCGFIIPSQVNRGAEHGKPISADDARDSGVVDETGDFVVSLFRPDQVVDKANVTGEMLPQDGGFKAQILKSRHGNKGRVAALKLSLLSLAIVDVMFEKGMALKVEQENRLVAQGMNYDDFRKGVEGEMGQGKLL